MQDILKILIPIIIAHACVLVIIVLVIKRLLLSDTTRAIKRINEVEAEVRKKEEAIRKQIDDHEKEFARKRQEAEEELERHRTESEREVAAIREQVISDANSEGEKIIQQAKSNEEKMREQMAREAEEKAVDYGAEIFQLVFSDTMTAELNKHFIDELIEALAEVDGSAITVDANDSNFTSSHPMDGEQRTRLEALLKEKFGTAVSVNERVDASLIAGLVFKLGSLEIDGSLRSRFEEATSELKKHATHA